MKKILGSLAAAVGLLGGLLVPIAAHAAPSQVVVTPTNTQGWTASDTRPGGAVNFVNDATAPGNPANGALQLTTDSTTTAKAQYMHDSATPLSSVTELGYATKQNSSPFPGAGASYQLALCALGVSGTTCNGFTTMVFEPYENGVVAPGAWQTWDVMGGQLWSSRTVSGGTCQLTAGAGGAPFYSVAAVQAACPSAVVVGFGVNVGSNNPGYDVEADLVDFNGTTYNFEPYVAVSDPNACKKDGWMTAVDANGNGFKNQGACVSYVTSSSKSEH